MSQTITPELVSLDVGLGADKAAVIRALAARVVAQGRATDADALFADAWAREQKDETGPPRRHRDPARQERRGHRALARLRAARSRASTSAPPTARPTSSSSSPRPEGAAEAHLAVLSKLARSLMQDDFTSRPARREDERRRRRDRAQRDRRGGCLGCARPQLRPPPPRPPRPPLRRGRRTSRWTGGPRASSR